MRFTNYSRASLTREARSTVRKIGRYRGWYLQVTNTGCRLFVKFTTPDGVDRETAVAL